MKFPHKILALMIVAVGAVVVPSAPATAVEAPCAAVGNANVEQEHLYLPGPSTTSRMNMIGWGPGGTCSLFVSAQLTGTCEVTTGYGWAEANGQYFTVTGSHYDFVFTGGVVGTATLTSGSLAPCRGVGRNEFIAVFNLAIT